MTAKLAALALLLALSGAIQVEPAVAQTLDDALEHHRAGRFPEALEVYRGVAEANAQENPAAAAAAWNNSCLIWINLSEYERALETCEASLELRRSLDDPAPLARVLNNLALVFQNLGQYDRAAEHYRESLAINRQSGNLLSASQNLINLSSLSIQAGRYGDALDAVAEVLELSDRNPQEDWAAEQKRLGYINEGVVLEKLGAYRAALESYQHALAVGATVSASDEALLLVNLGVVYRNLGDPIRAVELFEEASATYRRLENGSGLSNALLNTALAEHLNLGRPLAAERNYREALDLSQASGDRPEEIQDLFYLASLLFDQGRLEESLSYFKRSLVVSEESGSAEGRWSSLAGLGRIAAARGNHDEAMQHFERALQAIEEVRSRLDSGSNRAEFFGDKRSVFAAALQTAAVLEERDPNGAHAAQAFELAQRAKARELLDAIGRERSESARPQSHTELRGILGRGVLVEFFAAEHDLLRWVLDGDSFNMSNLGPARPILDRVRTIHGALADGRVPDPESLESLGETLLQGLDFDTLERIHIAGDSALRYLPFEILPVRSNSPVHPTSDTPELMVDRVVIDYLPSGSALFELSQQVRKARTGMVAVANPTLDASGSLSSLLAERFALEDLPAAEAEVASMAHWLGGESLLLTGSEATEAALERAISNGPRVVHLATHAVIDERPGQGAAVLLTPDDTDDGLLYPREIAALDLAADLAVLAACQTALGDEEAGSSMATLTGAFLAAGASGVIATLWEVGDESTAAFMDQFYWHLGRGATPAEALRLVKLEFRSNGAWRAPHLWAGYVLTGDAPAVATRRLPWALAALVVGLVALTLVFVRRRRRA